MFASRYDTASDDSQGDVGCPPIVQTPPVAHAPVVHVPVAQAPPVVRTPVARVPVVQTPPVVHTPVVPTTAALPTCREVLSPAAPVQALRDCSPSVVVPVVGAVLLPLPPDAVVEVNPLQSVAPVRDFGSDAELRDAVIPHQGRMMAATLGHQEEKRRLLDEQGRLWVSKAGRTRVADTWLR
jgi:hypothetical protein